MAEKLGTVLLDLVSDPGFIEEINQGNSGFVIAIEDRNFLCLPADRFNNQLVLGFVGFYPFAGNRHTGKATAIRQSSFLFDSAWRFSLIKALALSTISPGAAIIGFH